MSRAIRGVAALIALQAGLIATFCLIEQRRSSRDPEPELRTDGPQSLDGVLVPLSLETRSGERFELREVNRPTLVHVWATWCPPCRVELPGLLSLPAKHPIDVVAVALDEAWTTVDPFLDEQHRSRVYLGKPSAIAAALDVHSLPVTYLVQPDQRLRLRFDGARDWTDRAFLSTWMSAVGLDYSTPAKR